MNVSRSTRNSFQRVLVLLTVLVTGAALATPVAAAPRALPGAAGRAAIQVVVTGLDASVAARVTVAGPHGYLKRLTKSATVANLLPGTYRVTARPVTTATGPAAASVTPAKVVLTRSRTVKVQVAYVVNLLVNPGFESGAAVASVPEYKAFATDAWTPLGTDGTGKPLGADTFPYATLYANGINGGPTASTAGPRDRGARYASGGIHNTKSTLTQTVALDALAAVIGTGQAHFVLSGWLGGYASQVDAFALTVTFLDAGGQPVGSGAIAPVTPADRSNATALILRSTTGVVPATTRSATVQLASVPATGGSYNDAYADNILLAIG
jgi:hypothetical protein